MIQQPSSRAVAGWRPQGFGRANAHGIRDPLIEPLWIGRRVLVRIDAGETSVVDEAGVAIHGAGAGAATPGDAAEAADIGDMIDAVRRATRADAVVLDGYLTRQATMPPRPVPIGEVRTLGAGELTAQMFLGRRARHNELVEEAATVAAVEASDSPIAFVAVDLIEIDGLALLDVPLLERKRILESAIQPGELVRIGPYVRPPVDPWLGTWRALGFTSVAYKAANGRYFPGAPNDGWARARIPNS